MAKAFSPKEKDLGVFPPSDQRWCYVIEDITAVGKWDIRRDVGAALVIVVGGDELVEEVEAC